MNMTLASDIEQQCLLENDKGLVQYQSSIAKPTEIKSDQAITKKEGGKPKYFTFLFLNTLFNIIL